MEAESATPVLSFDEFRVLVARELGVPEEMVVPGASFLDDLQADSIQLIDLLLHFDAEGIAIPLDAAWRIRTVQDAYELYAQSLQG